MMTFSRRSASLAAALTMALAAPAFAAPLSETFGAPKSGSTKIVDHKAWSELLSAYVVPSPDGVNRVRYADWKRRGHTALKSYVSALQAVDVASLDRNEQFAFWANLYNAKTIDVVLDAYPVRSIKDINLGGGLLTLVTGGPWKAKVVKISNAALSLDDIEHEILRPVFRDPRVHYAVNCASIGCPNLMPEAFTGEKLEAQLDAAARAYVNHPRGFKVGDGDVTASSIYDWFRKDFAGSADGVLGHARKYADPALKQKLKGIVDVANYDYDWSLNDAKP